jgi:putative peptide zinc metalloprotease protein
LRACQRVRLVLDQWTRAALRGQEEEIARVELEEQPALLLATAGIASRNDPHGRPRPLETSYQVRISLDSHTAPLLPGAPGRCHISAAWQPIGQRVWRYLSRTFRLDAR